MIRYVDREMFYEIRTFVETFKNVILSSCGILTHTKFSRKFDLNRKKPHATAHKAFRVQDDFQSRP